MDVSIFLPIAIAIPIYLIIPFLLYNKRQHNKRKDPFNEFDIPRPAGHSLNAKLLDLSFDIGSQLVLVIALSALIVLVIAIDNINSITTWAINLGFTCALIYTGWKLTKLQKTMQNYRDGLNAELIVGQSLTKLLPHNFYVYHDIPATNFNVDHVVVSPNGVYAIETKSRRKLIENEGHKVRIENNKLEFKSWTETKPIEQAKSIAIWLSEHLTGSVGEQIKVQPILALPGYFIERKDRNSLPVLNHKNLMSPKNFPNNQVLSDKVIQQICYQLEQAQKKEN